MEQGSSENVDLWRYGPCKTTGAQIRAYKSEYVINS
jgi:hypothetical protein